MATDTVTTQDVPATLKPYATSLLENAFNYANPNTTPYYGLGSYQTATGETPFAQINPLQRQSYTESAGLGPSAYLGQGANLAGMAGLGSLTAGSDYMGAASNPYAVGSFMSPYMQNVVESQKSNAIRDYSRSLPTMGYGAAKAGGYGGTRSALLQAEGNRNLQNQLQGIQTQGTQQAFQNAQDILNRGTQFNLQGYGQGINAASTLGNLGQSQFSQNLQAIQNRNAMGKDIYGMEQNVAGQKYSDYQAAMNDPMTKMNFLSGILSKIPTGSNQNVSSSNTGLDWLTGIGSILSAYAGIK